MIRYGLCRSIALFPVQAAKKIKPMDAYDYSGFCEVLRTSDSIDALGDLIPHSSINRVTIAPATKIEDLTKIVLTEYYVVKGEWIAGINAFTPSTFSILKVWPTRNNEPYKTIVERLI